MLAKGLSFRLRNLGLPVIRGIADLAEATRLSESKVRYLCYCADALYKTYPIPKADGSSRTIAQPSRELKALQGWVLRNVLNRLQASPYSKGFELGSSILDNAAPHVGSTFVLNLDIDNFFPSIPASSVYSVFSSVGYGSDVAAALTNICTFRGFLPQGAPTSPKLSNLVCLRLDARIQGYAGPRGIVFTRYADDITLSAQTLKKIVDGRRVVEMIIASEGLVVNQAKTNISGTWKRREVTGLVLNQTSAGLGRVCTRKVRAKIFDIFMGRSIAFSEVNGWLAYAHGVDRQAFRKLCSFIDEMIRRYPTAAAVEHIRKPGQSVEAVPAPLEAAAQAA